LNLGIALLNQKKFPESEEQFRVALTKQASSPVAHMYLGMALMNQKKLDEAQKELETAVVSKSTEVGVAHKYLGGIYWGQRDYKRAGDELETYLQMVPKAADADRTRAAIKELRSKN
jgi:tetratricopeptide (TPR) repeat protein